MPTTSPWRSYAYNAYFLVNPQWSRVHAANTMVQVTHPSETIVFGESMSNGSILYYPSHKLDESLGERFLFDRHNDGCNYAFVDGHATWLHSGRFPPDNSTVPEYYHATRFQ